MSASPAPPRIVAAIALAAAVLTGCSPGAAGGGALAPATAAAEADTPPVPTPGHAAPAPAPTAGSAVPVEETDAGTDDAATADTGDAPQEDAPELPTASATAPPDWLGTRVLARSAEGFGVVTPTPAELVDRRITTTDLLAPPADDTFHATTTPVPDEVLARSTWDPACPVTRDELAYVTVSFWGFDGAPHTGELLVHRDVADAVVEVFAELHAARFPVEEMRVVRPGELDAPPTGDGNNTTAFVCRPTRGQTRWSEHAYGRAVDVNPFHNPYVKGELVLPELASAYTDRGHERPGMVRAGGPVTTAFGAIGWGWGGAWSSLTDWMHFSAGGT